MRKAFSALLLLCGVSALTCPNRKASTATWIPRRACWPNPETSVYDVLKQDTVAGRSVFQIRQTELDGRPVYEVTGVNSSFSGPARAFHDSVVAWLTPDSLKSVRTFQVRNALVRLDTVVSDYQRNSVTVTSRAGASVLPVSNNAFDNSILTMVIRTLDLKPGARYLLSSVAAFGPWAKPADIEVLGDEAITVPAGAFLCRKVALQLGGWTMTLWIEQNLPHRYVRFENRNNNSSAVLAEYETAHE